MTPTKSDLSIIDIIRLLFRHKVWLITLTFLGAAAGFVIGAVQQPVYRAETLLTVVDKSDVRGGLAGIAKQFGGLAGAINLGDPGSSKNVAIAVLRSRAFIVSFIRDRGIEKVLFSDLFDPRVATSETNDQRVPTDAEIFALFTKQVFAVREDNKTGLVTVSIEWKDADIAADWANELVREINTQLRTRARIRARNSVEYLESEAAQVSNMDTRKAIYNLIESQINEIMLANVTEEYAFEVIDPASAPDADDYVAPRKVFLLASGLVAGFMLAIVVIVGRELGKTIRAEL